MEVKPEQMLLGPNKTTGHSKALHDFKSATISLVQLYIRIFIIELHLSFYT